MIIRRLIIEDDGCGFEQKPQTVSQGIGIQAIRERLDLLQGTLTIESEPGSGTTLFVSVPRAG